MRIIIATHGFSASTYKVGSFHIAKSLVYFGNSVLSISFPISPFHIGKITNPEIRKKFKLSTKGIYKTKFGFYEYIPFSIIPLSIYFAFAPKIFFNFHTFILPPVKFLLTRKEFLDIDVLIIEHSRFIFLKQILKYKKLIYRVTDIYPFVLKNKYLYRLEEKIIKEADKIVVTSTGIKEFLQENFEVDKEIIVIENGVDVDFFLRKEKKHSRTPKIWDKYNYKIIYVGAIDNRIDIDLLIHTAKQLKNKNIGIFLFGQYNNNIKNRIKNVSNLHLMGKIDYEYLPILLKKADVGILPFRKIKENDGRSPMKLYEYGICKLPVVAVKTKDIEAKKEKFVLISENYEDFVENIERAIRNKETLGNIAFESSLKMDWKEKTKKLIEN